MPLFPLRGGNVFAGWARPFGEWATMRLVWIAMMLAMVAWCPAQEADTRALGRVTPDSVARAGVAFDPAQSRGVFIHYFLSELATKRRADPETGAVRVEDLVGAVNESVSGWVTANPAASAAFAEAGAKPGITYLPSGPEIMQLPLAIDLERNQAIAAEKARLTAEAQAAASAAAAAVQQLELRRTQARTHLASALAEDPDTITAALLGGVPRR